MIETCQVEVVSLVDDVSTAVDVMLNAMSTMSLMVQIYSLLEKHIQDAGCIPLHSRLRT